MLGSLGYAEAESRAEADLILFNTCSIREIADSRFLAHLGEAKRLKSEDDGRRRRRRRLLGAVGQGRGLRALSVRRRRLRARADPQARRVPDQRLADRPGVLRVRGVRRPPADRSATGRFRPGCRSRRAATAPAPTASSPRPGAGRRAGRPRELLAEVRGLAADGVREVTLLGQNVNSYGRDLRGAGQPELRRAPARASTRSTGIDRIRYTSPHPKDMKEDVIAAHAECAAVCEHIHLPLQSGSSRILKAMRRTYDREPLSRPGGTDPRARSRRRDHDRHHRRLPGRDRGGLRRDARGRRGGRLRRRLHVRLQPPARHRGGEARRHGSPPGQEGADGAPRRGGPAARPRAVRSASSAARSTSSSRGRAGPIRRGSAAAAATTRPSTSRERPRPERSSRSRSSRRRR